MSDEFDFFGLWEDERKLAIAMLNGFEAEAFDKPHSPEDVAYWESVLAECDAKLAGRGRA